MSQNRPANGDHPKELISAYLDGQLEAPDRVRVFEHLRVCDACRWLLSDYRALALAARREGAPPVPADLANRIGKRIDAEPVARFTWRRRLVTAARLPLATAAAVLVLASLWIVWRGRLPGERLAEAPPPAPPAEASAPGVAAGGDAGVGSGVAGKVGNFGYAGGRQRADWREAGDQDAGRPKAPAAEAPGGQAPPRLERTLAAPAQKPDQKKDDVAHDMVALEEKQTAARSVRGIPPPEANARAVAAAPEVAPAPAQESTSGPAPGTAVEPASAGVMAVAPGVAADVNTQAVAAAVPTLVFVLPEARVTILPDSRVNFAARNYDCTVPATGPDDTAAIGELRDLARQGQPAGAAAGSGPAAGAQAATAAPPAGVAPPAAGVILPSGVSGKLIIPVPPATGSLSPDLAARMHVRLWALMRERLLARAEAQCGPVPEALQQFR